MDNRCTIVTRIHTADGLVSEVYTGDTDVEQALIVGIIHDELAPRLLGRSAADPEGAWRAMEPATNDILRDRGLALQAIACARRGDLGRLRAGARAAAPPGVGQRRPTRCRSASSAATTTCRATSSARSMARYVEAGFGGVKFKVGGRTPAEDAARVRAAREALGPDVALMVDANQGYDRAQAVEFGRLVGDLGIRWFEEPCRWTNDRRWMRDVRYQTGHPGLCRSERDDPARDPRPHRRRRDRRLQLRRVVGGRPDDLAQGRRACRRVRRRARPPRGAADRLAPPRERRRTTPSSSASTRSATRSSGA